jgi:hypothetical protein
MTATRRPESDNNIMSSKDRAFAPGAYADGHTSVHMTGRAVAAQWHDQQPRRLGCVLRLLRQRHAVPGEHAGGDIRPAAAGDEHMPLRVLPDQHTHRQVERQRGMRPHHRRPGARAAEQDHRAPVERHAGGLRRGGMVRLAEHHPALLAHRRLEALNGGVCGVRARPGDQAVACRARRLCRQDQQPQPGGDDVTERAPQSRSAAGVSAAVGDMAC